MTFITLCEIKKNNSWGAWHLLDNTWIKATDISINDFPNGIPINWSK